MRILGPDSSDYRIDRVWLPWRRRLRDVPDTGNGWSGGDSLGDDPISALIGIFLLILLLPVLLFLLVAAVELLLLSLLVVPFAFARSLFGIPWTIRVTRDGVVLRTDRVKGWFASRRRMGELEELVRTGLLAPSAADPHAA